MTWAHDPIENQYLVSGQLQKNTWPRWAAHLSPRYGHVILASRYLVLTGVINRNMDVQYQRSKRYYQKLIILKRVTSPIAYGHFVCACARWMEYLSSAHFVWTRTRCVGFLNGWSTLRERSCQKRWKIITSLHTFLTLWICTLFVGTLDEDILMIKVRT